MEALVTLLANANFIVLKANSGPRALKSSRWTSRQNRPTCCRYEDDRDVRSLSGQSIKAASPGSACVIHWRELTRVSIHAGITWEATSEVLALAVLFVEECPDVTE
jgi:hypothetical protein